MRRLLAALGLASLVGTAHGAEYAVGQVWTYKTRPGEEASTLQINKIEDYPKIGRVYHVSVLGVHVRNSKSPQGFTAVLPHFPVSKGTLDNSVVSLTKQQPRNVGYEAGYAQWKQAIDASSGGVFTITVAEIVDFAEKALSQSP